MKSQEQSTNPKVIEELKEFGLDWNVIKKPLFFESEESDGATPFFATVREDTEAPLGTVSSRYEPKQNGEILQLIHDASKTHDLTLDRAGAFKGGRSVYFQLEMPESIRINDDEVEKYLFAYTAHDGSSSLRFGLCNRVISCQNQFNYMLKKSKFSVRHTQSIHEQAQMLSEKIGAILLKEDNLYAAFMKFADKEVDAKMISALTDEVFKMDKYWAKHDEMSTRRENQIVEFTEPVESQIAEKGANGWGLFNGVTHYANHKKSFPNRENGHLESIMDGGSQKFMMRGFNFLRKEFEVDLNLN